MSDRRASGAPWCPCRPSTRPIDSPSASLSFSSMLALPAWAMSAHGWHGRSPRYRQATQQRPSHRPNTARWPAGRIDTRSRRRPGAVRRLVLLEGRLHHRAEGRSVRGISRHDHRCDEAASRQRHAGDVRASSRQPATAARCPPVQAPHRQRVTISGGALPLHLFAASCV